MPRNRTARGCEDYLPRPQKTVMGSTMIPTLRLLHCCLLWAGIGVGASLWKPAEPVWLAAGAVWLAASLVDGVWLFLMKRLQVERDAPARVALGVDSEMTVTIRNPNRLAVRLRLIDGLPDSLVCREWPWSGRIAGNSFASVSVTLRATSRGSADITAASVEHTSPLGLWVRRYRRGDTQTVRVFPNYEPVVRFALLAMQHRESQMGIQHRNRPGQSREFRQLRDFNEGDPMNRMDWKATSRRLILTTREFEEQRNQTVILMADCGRRLRAMDGDLTQFDHCLNAMLLLSFIALRQGDRVGIMGFGGTDRWLPPQTGTHSMPAILNHLYDYAPGREPGDFNEAADLLLRRQKRRALVVFCTNLRSEDQTHLLRPLQLIRRRHLVVVASLREKEVIARLVQPVQSEDSARSFGAAVQYAEDRQFLLQNLRQAGIRTIDAPAEALATALGNLYLDIKAEGAL